MKNRQQFQFPDSIIHQAKCEAMASTSTTNIRSKDHVREFLENRLFHSKKQHRTVPQSAPSTPAIEVSKDELSTWFKKLTMNMVSSNQITESGTGSSSAGNNKMLMNNNNKKSSNSSNKKQMNQNQSSYDNLKNKSRNLFHRKTSQDKERATSVGPISRSKSSLWKESTVKDNYDPIYQNFSPFRSNNDKSSIIPDKSFAHHQQSHQQMLNSQPKRASFPQSKSMMNFSKSYHDLRNEQIQDNCSKPITTKKRIKNLILNHENPCKSSSLTPSIVPGNNRSNSGSVSHLAPKPIAMSLLDFVSSQLRSEQIDLTDEPYTDQSGFCGIPPALVQRYAEETGRDLYEVADALDHIRLSSLDGKGRRGIPNDFLADSCSGLVLEQANCENLTVWLTSLGLPMYHQHLVANGWKNLQAVSKMKEGDLLSSGVIDKRHLRTMIRAISALNVTIQKISSCYEHNYESIQHSHQSTLLS